MSAAVDSLRSWVDTLTHDPAVQMIGLWAAAVIIAAWVVVYWDVAVDWWVLLASPIEWPWAEIEKDRHEADPADREDPADRGLSVLDQDIDDVDWDGWSLDGKSRKAA